MARRTTSSTWAKPSSVRTFLSAWCCRAVKEQAPRSKTSSTDGSASLLRRAQPPPPPRPAPPQPQHGTAAAVGMRVIPIPGVPSAIRRRLVWLVPRLRRGARSREACAVVATANSQATTGALVRACKAAVAPPHRPQRRHRRQRRYTRTGGVGRRRPRSRSSRQPRGRGAREAVAARAGGALGGALGGLGRTPRRRRRTKTTTMAIGRCRFRSDFSSLTATTTRMLRRTRSWCRGRTTEVKMNIALD